MIQSARVIPMIHSCDTTVQGWMKIMSSIVKVKDKRSGITYAYESVSYWDKEKKAPRNRRTLIGRVDEATGEIVPTDGRRRNKMVAEHTESLDDNGQKAKATNEPSGNEDRLDTILQVLQELTNEVRKLQDEIRAK